MKEHRLIRKQEVSREVSYNLITMMAKHGNHYQEAFFRTNEEVVNFFQKKGVNFEKLVENCRHYQVTVPFFENLIGCTWTVSGRARVSRVDRITGKEDLIVEGPGAISMSTYWSLYETANESLKQAINKGSYTDLQSAIVLGIASIEAYINHRAEEWNMKNPTDLLFDSKLKKVSFEDKIDIWIPKMASGKKLDKSNRNWADFKVLCSIRDNLTIHPKSTGFSISIKELADLINRFRTGIAGLLVQLHLIFEEKIPAVIIRGYYAPEVEVTEVEVK
jgi:hypothetical protein